MKVAAAAAVWLHLEDDNRPNELYSPADLIGPQQLPLAAAQTSPQRGARRKPEQVRAAIAQPASLRVPSTLQLSDLGHRRRLCPRSRSASPTF